MRADTLVLKIAAFAFAAAVGCAPSGTFAQQKNAPPAKETAGGGARLMVYHQCNAFSFLSGGSFSGADGHVYVADKNMGRTPVCSVRSFKISAGEHTIQIKDWAGLSFGFDNRKVRVAAGETAHIVVGKAKGGAFFWEAVSPTQASALAAEIKSVAK